MNDVDFTVETVRVRPTVATVLWWVLGGAIAIASLIGAILAGMTECGTVSCSMESAVAMSVALLAGVTGLGIVALATVKHVRRGQSAVQESQRQAGDLSDLMSLD